MGVSQSRSVLDLLPASGSASGKRNQSNGNQAMFDIALQSASKAIPQASGKEKPVKQDVTANNKAEEKGKAIPHNGKELPAKTKETKSSGQSSASDNRADAVASADDPSKPRHDGEPEIKETSSKSEEQAVSDKSEGRVAADTTEPQQADDTNTQQVADSEQEAVSAAVEAEKLLSQLESEELSAEEFLAKLESEELSAEEFLAKLEQLLQAEGISLDDLRQYLDQQELLASERFDQLLDDPQAFIAQLQQLMQRQQGPEQTAFLKDIGVSADVAARLNAVFSNRTFQDTAAPRFADILKAESSGPQADNLVSQLLKEQGSGKDASSGFDRDKLFEQLLAQKGADSNAKVSGFAGLMLKEGAGQSLGQASALLGASAGSASGAEGLQALAQRQGIAPQQALPQLPVLRGLPGQQPGATEALNERIMMMRSKGIQTAEIRLDPPDLGSLEVRVRVSGDSTTIQFHSPNPSVREALEQQVNRLREMMEDAGVNLGQVDVSDQSLSEESEEAYAASDNGSGGRTGGGSGESEDDSVDPISGSSQSALGLVDYFA